VLLLIVSTVVALLMICLAAYFGFAYHRYHSVPSREVAASSSSDCVRVGGFDLFVREVGSSHSGVPLLVVHGGPGHSSLSFHASLDPLAQERRILYYDQRGSGLSQLKADRSHYTVDALVHEIDLLRSDVLKADRIAILAHSAGGAIAQHYAAAHPDRIDRLVLVGSTTANNNMSNTLVWRLLGPGLYATALGFPPTDPELADDWFTSSQIQADTKRLHDRHRADLLLDSGPARFSTWFAVSQSLVGDDLAARLSHVTAPVLVVYGESDTPYTGEKAARRITSAFANGQLAPITSSGHWPFLENPDAFLTLVRTFLTEPPPEPAA
jgi:pimeloyl-ACP methyl ester carboxylesterase